MAQKTIIIGGIPYKLSPTEDIKDHNGNLAWGTVSHGEGEISYDSNQRGFPRAVTITHEALHVILTQAGVDQNEVEDNVIDALAYGIVSFIIQNPAFIAHILRLSKKP